METTTKANARDARKLSNDNFALVTNDGRFVWKARNVGIFNLSLANKNNEWESRRNQPSIQHAKSFMLHENLLPSLSFPPTSRIGQTVLIHRQYQLLGCQSPLVGVVWRGRHLRRDKEQRRDAWFLSCFCSKESMACTGQVDASVLLQLMGGWEVFFLLPPKHFLRSTMWCRIRKHK